jgi:hypothetical protein
MKTDKLIESFLIKLLVFVMMMAFVVFRLL